MRTCLMLLVTSLALHSCNFKDDSGAESSSMGSFTAESDTLLVLRNSQYDLTLTLPKSIMTAESKFQFRESFGDAELYVHPGFHVYISKEDTELSEIKKELQSDGLFSRIFTDESDGELLYQSTLPDGTEIGFGWVKSLSEPGLKMILRLDSQGNYSKQDVRTIQKHMKTLSIL